MLAPPGDLPPGRRRAYVRLFAGRADEARRDMGHFLARTPSAADLLASAFDDLCVMLAIADGSLSGGLRVIRRIANQPTPVDEALQVAGPQQNRAGGLIKLIRIDAEPPPHPGTNDVPRPFAMLSRERQAWFAYSSVMRRKQMLIEWGSESVRADQPRCASSFFAAALDAVVDREEAEVTVAAIYAKAEGHVGTNESTELLESLWRRASDPFIRRLLKVKVANVHFKERQWEACLRELDEADAQVADGPAAGPALQVGLMRTRALIELERFDEARQLVQRMMHWRGDYESRSKVLYLMAFIHLELYEREEALEVLRRLVDQYPQTRAAEAARKLIENLEEK